jgi:eukaryotic-like serine/threonine-protein kinase
VQKPGYHGSDVRSAKPEDPEFQLDSRPVSGTEAAADPWLGRVLDGRYRVLERLGEGGMGAVFVAEHLKLRKAVALKVIRAELAGNGEVAARFAREAMTTAQFEHPHVASAIDFGTLEEGGAYLVMQLVRGRSLRELIEQRGKLAWPIACELAAQIADALSAARLAGIVHRDLKPDNVLVEEREDGSFLARILDFGIAHVAPQLDAEAEEGGARTLTRVGTVMGTPGYMSPEQAVGDRVDHRTDLYALGVVLWECLAGRVLWDGPDVTSIITKQLREDVPRLRELLGDARLPVALDELLQRLCARAADDRPAHAGTVRDELRALASQSGSPVFELRGHALFAWARAREWYTALTLVNRALVAAAALFLLLLGVSAALSESPDAPPPVFVPKRELAQGSREPAAPAVDRESAAPSDPSLAQRALDLITPGARGSAAGSGVPKELAADAAALLGAKSASERRSAAKKLIAYKPASAIAPYLRAVARLEQARSCRERKDAIADLAELKDARVKPPLQRLSDTPRSGCGFLRLRDCNACVRQDLRKALDALD